MNTDSTTTNCLAAIRGANYDKCDVVGGCRTCRDLALSDGDKDQLKAWLIARSAL